MPELSSAISLKASWGGCISAAAILNVIARRGKPPPVIADLRPSRANAT